jgi:hypothetical protein
MIPFVRTLIAGVAIASIVTASACKEEETAAPRPPAATASKSSPPPAPTSPASPHNPHAAQTPAASGPKPMGDVDISAVKMSDKKSVLTGVSMTIPEGWVSEPPTGMSRVAQFKLPKADTETEDAAVAVTYFPAMKGMDEANLNRWFGQFKQPDGSPTASVATRADFDLGGVKITVVDMSGSMLGDSSMMSGGAARPKHRMVAAIINHKAGPHFFKLTGPDDVVGRWKPSAIAFLKSAKANE